MNKSLKLALAAILSVLVLILATFAAGLSPRSMSVALQQLQPHRANLQAAGESAAAPDLLSSAATLPAAVTLVPAVASKLFEPTAPSAPTVAAMGVATAMRVQSSFSDTLREALVPRLIEGIQFLPGSNQLTPESTVRLDEVATLLRHKPEWHIDVLGHTDNTGSAVHNLALSKARADIVSNYLKLRGISPARLNARGLGETRPVSDNKTEEGRHRNRRVELSIRKHLIY